MKHQLSLRSFKCVWCGEVIPAGAEIIRHVALWQSDGVDWRLHPECRDACARDGNSDFTLFDNPRGATMAEHLLTVPKRSRRSEAGRNH